MKGSIGRGESDLWLEGRTKTDRKAFMSRNAGAYIPSEGEKK